LALAHRADRAIDPRGAREQMLAHRTDLLHRLEHSQLRVQCNRSTPAGVRLIAEPLELLGECSGGHVLRMTARAESRALRF